MKPEIAIPQYLAHTITEALQIKDIYTKDGGDGILVPVSPQHESIKVSASFLALHKPHVGDYFIRDNNGERFVTADTFERDHTLISTDTQISDSQATRMFALCGAISSIKSSLPILPGEALDSRDVDRETVKELRAVMLKKTEIFVELFDILGTIRKG